ncbi:hypothetical protein ACFVJH_37350 [Streptomyces decoyicus]|uniref:hypothetical protein n=1 Tax=Streptomyces decoyicus TaxID=249567 RepID=UPI00364186FE
MTYVDASAVTGEAVEYLVGGLVPYVGAGLVFQSLVQAPMSRSHSRSDPSARCTFAASADHNVPVQLSPDGHDACLWADEAGQERVSPAVKAALDTWTTCAERR